MEASGASFSSRIEQKDAEGRLSLASECAQQMATNDGRSIVGLLEDLGPLLTSSSVNSRLVGVSFLSSVLSLVRPNLLADVGLLVKFYSDRLKNDHHSLQVSN